MDPQEQLAENNRVLGQIVQNYVDRQNKLRDRETERGYRLQDLAEERTYEQSAADIASQRRMKEYSNQERLRAIHEAIKRGVPNLDETSTMKDVTRENRAFDQDLAGKQLDIMDAQKSAAEDNAKASMQRLLAVIGKNSPQDPKYAEARRDALQIALADPSSTVIPGKVRAQLQSILSTGGDPQAAVKQVVDQLQEQGAAWPLSWLPGKTDRDTAFKNAFNFFDKYQTALAAKVGPERQLELATRMKDYEDTLRESQDINRLGMAHVKAFAGSLSPERIKAWTSRVGAPKTAMDILSDPRLGDLPKPASASNPQPMSGQEQLGPPFPTATGDSIDEVGNPPVPGIGDTYEESGAAGVFRKLQDPRTYEKLVLPPAEFLNRFPGPSDLADAGAIIYRGDPPLSAPAPTKQQVLDNRELVRRTGSAFAGSALPASRLQPPHPDAKPATQEEINAVKALALKYGVPQSEIDAAGDKIKSGDPKAIAGWNTLLNWVRSPMDTNSPPPVPSTYGGGYPPPSWIK